MRNAWANGDHDAIAAFWLILELISRHEDRNAAPGYIKLSPAVLKNLMHKNERGLVAVLSKVSSYFGEGLVITWSKLGSNMGSNMVETSIPHMTLVSDQFVQFFCRKWLKFQERRGGKQSQKNDKDPGDIRNKKRDIRNKNIRPQDLEKPNELDPPFLLTESDPVGFPLVAESPPGDSIGNSVTAVLEGVSDIAYFEPICVACKKIDPSLYPDKAFTDREIRKMLGWLKANPHKSPKSKAGWYRFVSTWFERGWEKHRKTIPSNPVKQTQERDWVDTNTYEGLET